jgi:hypothetical protein
VSHFSTALRGPSDRHGFGTAFTINRTTNAEPSVSPFLSNILVHVNGAELKDRTSSSGILEINSEKSGFEFTVIDGQHRVNGAYLALMITREKDPSAVVELPATVFINLDTIGQPPKKQAQIFIDVNYYQKRVDKSLVVDLFPTARSSVSFNDVERAQDIGRKLMLETGPLN